MLCSPESTKRRPEIRGNPERPLVNLDGFHKIQFSPMRRKVPGTMAFRRARLLEGCNISAPPTILGANAEDGSVVR